MRPDGPLPVGNGGWGGLFAWWLWELNRLLEAASTSERSASSVR